MVEALLEKKASKRRTGPTMTNQNKDGETVEVSSLPDDVAEDLVQLFKLFADDTRLRILHYLMQQKEINVRTICERLGQSQPAVSHHLALLRMAGLIDCRRDGKHNFYHIEPNRLQEFKHMVNEAAPRSAAHVRLDSFSTS